MIREYALEPELVASWHELIVGRFFIDQFGSGTGRVVSRYPRKWRRLVWDAFEAAFGGGAGDIERKRIEELLAQLVVPEVRRPNCIWDETKDWLANTETEHARKPFFAILARENPRTNVAVICASDVLRGTPPAWPAPNSVVVARTADAMSAAIAPMLACATKVLFIDPYFRAVKPEFNRPLAAFLKLLAVAVSDISVELHTADREETPPWDSFRRECEEYLPRVIPKSLRARPGTY